MNKHLISASLLGLAVAAAHAYAAEGFSYTYGELQADAQNFDNGHIDGNGLTLNGSVATGDHLFVLGGYRQGILTIDRNNGHDHERDNTVTAGVGAHTALMDNVDLVGSGQYLHRNINHDDDSGYLLSVGPRARFGEKFEVQGTVDYAHVNSQGDFSFGAEGRYNLLKNVQLVANVDTDQHRNAVQWTVGVRANLAR